MVKVSKTYMPNWLGPKPLASKEMAKNLAITKKTRPEKCVSKLPKKERLSRRNLTAGDSLLIKFR